MDRGQALIYVSNEFRTLANDLSVLAEDDNLGWKSVIDAAFLSLDVPYTSLASATVDDNTQAQSLIALLNYYAVRRLMRAAATRIDLQTGHPAQLANRSQIMKNLQALLADVERDLVSIGLGVEQLEYGRFNLDFLEPCLEFA
jgi:hypothetical protein